MLRNFPEVRLNFGGPVTSCQDPVESSASARRYRRDSGLGGSSVPTAVDRRCRQQSAVGADSSRQSERRWGSAEFMLCRQEEKDPRKCLAEGRAVTSCALEFFRKVKSTCLDEFNQYANCLDRGSPDLKFRM
ncbi:NADH dehydrogenase [ubiquinone] 1 alpha subcomplex subunit 8 [Amphibalanus amphitrite]|uniref:NADH dehydrogenase [ubiquinone] 1 alpha subcomplex subunit 8 n=1 Tax=Amphibalanus amphitrite TaxID=1232801 RepID=A0A6A4V7V0_AMPAM|nr:NADH dehydrogenase [ubiquinone] 1 alpha subcomplex subunit 8 [Amphibalanus amphitrite]